MANIQPQDQRINTSLQVVDYTPLTNTTLQTGAFRAQQEIAANTKKITRANKAMAEFKQKAEERQLTKEASAYISKLGKSQDPVTQQVMQSLAVNTEDPKEIKGFMNAVGGPTEALKLINETADSTRQFQQDKQLEAFKQQGKANGTPVLIPQGTGTAYADEMGYSSISTKPYVAEDGTVYDQVTSSSAGPTKVEDEEDTFVFPEWSLVKNADGTTTPDTQATNYIDADGDGINDILQYIDMSSTGKRFIQSETIDKSSDPVTLAATEEAKAFGKKRGEDQAKMITDYENNRQQKLANLGRYDQVLASMIAEGSFTGGFIEKFIPNAAGFKDKARTLFNPTGQDALDNVASVVMQSLKDILGGAFSEREGQRLIDAAYNPGLGPEENARRLLRARNIIAVALQEQDKMYQYYVDNGNLSGYTVMPLSVVNSMINDFELDMYNDNINAAKLDPNNDLLQDAVTGERKMLKVE